MKSFLVPDNLDSNLLVGLVVTTFKGLSEAALSKEIENLIPVDQMILEHDLVVPSIIIETIIVLKMRRGLNLWGIKS